MDVSKPQLTFRRTLFIVAVLHAALLAIAAVAGIGHAGGPLQAMAHFIRSWDADIYAAIATQGYAFHGLHPTYGFWPFWPLFLRLWLTIFPFVSVVGEIVVTTLTAGAVYWLYRLLRLDYDEHISRRTIWLLLAYPAAFFFGALYSEAMVIFLAVLAFYGARTRRWWLAGVAGLGLVLARHTGIFILLPILIEFIFAYRNRAARLVSAWWFALVPVGALIFPFWVYLQTSVPMAALDFQRKSFFHAPSNPLTEVMTYIQQVGANPRLAWSLLGLLFLAVCLGFLLREARRRTVRPSYWTYGSLLCLFPLLTTNNLIGLVRYGLGMWPLFLGLSLNLKNRPIRYAVFGLMAAGQAVLVYAWAINRAPIL